MPDLELIGKSQCFPLYYYDDEGQHVGKSLFEDGYSRKDGITDFILSRAQRMYGKKVTKEDIFFYVYGLLHSPNYRNTFDADLKKMLPRLPLVEKQEDFWAFSEAGRKLKDLHVGYESVPPCPGVLVSGEEKGFFRVKKMRFAKNGKDAEKETILYNRDVTITNIPLRAYDYVVNGKSAIEWIMERYQVTTHKDSGIQNDPNAWGEDQGNSRYILDLLLSVIAVSVKTMDIVESLPNFR